MAAQGCWCWCWCCTRRATGLLLPTGAAGPGSTVGLRREFAGQAAPRRARALVQLHAALRCSQAAARRCCMDSDGAGPLTASVVVDAGLGEHGVVLNLRLADSRAVVADDDQLGCGAKGGRGVGHDPLRREARPAAPGLLMPRSCDDIRAAWLGSASGCRERQQRSPGQAPRTLAGAQGLEDGLVAQSVLATLHHQRQAAVDVLLRLLLRVRGCGCRVSSGEGPGRRARCCF
jgi:hypothetical protein